MFGGTQIVIEGGGLGASDEQLSQPRSRTNTGNMQLPQPRSRTNTGNMQLPQPRSRTNTGSSRHKEVKPYWEEKPKNPEAIENQQIGENVELPPLDRKNQEKEQYWSGKSEDPNASGESEPRASKPGQYWLGKSVTANLQLQVEVAPQPRKQEQYWDGKSEELPQPRSRTNTGNMQLPQPRSRTNTGNIQRSGKI